MLTPTSDWMCHPNSSKNVYRSIRPGSALLPPLSLVCCRRLFPSFVDVHARSGVCVVQVAGGRIESLIINSTGTRYYAYRNTLSLSL